MVGISKQAANFYPRSPCGERPPRKCLFPTLKSISIHALLAESDFQFLARGGYAFGFLSTLSLRRATSAFFGLTFFLPYFYPRSPCGERPKAGRIYPKREGFLSTLSLRRATGGQLHRGTSRAISIHALLAESDKKCRPNVAPAQAISIHALLAESDNRHIILFAVIAISIHALLAESDSNFQDKKQQGTYFYPRSPCGERPARSLFSIRFL